MVQYNDRIAGRFLQATLGWGLLALLIGLYAALELQFWPANARQAVLSFGRLRPIHADLMIFAFAANALFAGMYHAVQRLCQVRIWSDRLALVHFWSWQTLQLASLITLAMGISQGRPLAEMEWPLDVALALIWGLLTFNVFMTLKQRRTQFLYVSLWFFIAGLVGFALFHVVNALAWPAGAWKSYPMFVGLADAVIQVWYEQNIKSFLLTIPFLGLMYYFVPKTSKKPLHSYRLAVLQFWALIFFSVWIGPSRFLYTSLPEWMQSLGLIFSLMLVAPSLGAVINGLLTIGTEDRKIFRNPAVLFFSLALVSYGLFVIMEAMVAFKSIHLRLQYTDWMSAQSHLASIGWIGSFIFGMAYVLVPKLWQQPLYSRCLGRWHFWISFVSLGLLFFSLATAGLIQGFHWFSVEENGLLVHPQFLSTLLHLESYHTVRMISGLLYLLGALVAVYNFYKTARGGQLQDSTRALEEHPMPPPNSRWERWERKVGPITFGILGLVLLGSLAQLLPLPNQQTDLKPYSPLVQQGRDIYVREGCVSCHTQTVRMALKEELRYGHASQGWEFQQDRPALWGQRRHGPDLHRIGNKFPHLWHYQHLIDPQATTPGSLMPPYPWLAKRKVDLTVLPERQNALQKVGAVYGPGDPIELYQAEAKKIQESLAQAQIEVDAEAEIIALIAYLQKLGTEGK
ncbi:MAG TPA: cbb3-type cytochrome c oxidase subunit I [Oligoflexus sp.]|uniref:cbb3-type cytochrome c oxidase subunit I n=1 Tax=Oligoflexus sp. TaxID=1971216 RepID=UPI002D57CA1F|nr:cbb3-type cytochrome c oxidase subunit I [Oligoflexus sp.]HYX37090.1 cbb3-type cytochrome c oxidase subunit I [Oligoflexus sp.]